MELHERWMVMLLMAKDCLMNAVTFGLWERVRGEVTWLDMKVKSK